MRPNRLRTIVLLAFALVLHGCAAKSSPRHQATVASGIVYESLAALQDTGRSLNQNGFLLPSEYREFSQHMLEALEAGKAFNQIVLAWEPGKPAPGNLAASAARLEDLTAACYRFLSPRTNSQARDALAAKVIAVERAIVNSLIAATQK